MGEEVVAQIELDVAGNADDDPARQELEDALGYKDGDDEQGSTSSSFCRVTPEWRSLTARRRDLRKVDRRCRY